MGRAFSQAVTPVDAAGEPSSTSLEASARPEPAAHLAVALPRPAIACYALFCDVERIPAWLGVVRCVHVTRRDHENRAQDVAFLCRLERATIGYSCRYEYAVAERHVRWSTRPGTAIQVRGAATFHPLGAEACLMTYELDIDLGAPGLPAFCDPLFDGHAPSASLADFRDYVLRVL
jgi:uncharacterized membrane protein